MISTSTSHKTVGFSKNRLLLVLAAWYAAVWVITAVAPLDRHDWFLENLLVIAALAILIGTYRLFPLSDLSYVLITAFMTLLPGDILATGTPPGVGFGKNRFMEPGDVLECGITHLGAQRHLILA